jgi:hypothetical protein
MAADFKPADLNKDGKVTPKEREKYKKNMAATAAPMVDPLERDKLAAEYQSAVGIIYSVPEIKPLFEKAIDEGWTADKFKAAVQNSEWYRSNNEYARMAWAQETLGGADWEASLQDARQAVRATATAMGSDVNEQELDALAKRYLYEGWNEPARKGLLNSALSENISYIPDTRGQASLSGGAGQLSDDLRNLARANGVSYSDSWYLAAAKSVASGLSTTSDWERDVREQAASLFPVYSEKIRSGMSVYDLASPYINTLAQELEINPNQVTLDDPYIRSALGGMDDKGDFAPMGLWDFQKKIRQDPRWENTSKAQNEMTSVTGRVMQMFGLLGG